MIEQEPLSAREMGARGEAAEEPEPLWFVQMMKLYPKQENRTSAAREARRLQPDAQLQMKIIQAVKFLRASEKWQKGFAPDAKNFLRDKRWKDAEGLAGYSSSVNGTTYDPEKHTQQKALDLPTRYGDTVKAPPKPEPSKPGSMREAIKAGAIEGWKKNHPGEEPPPALLSDPVGYLMGRIGGSRQRTGPMGQRIDPGEARRQVQEDLEIVKARMNNQGE